MKKRKSSLATRARTDGHSPGNRSNFGDVDGFHANEVAMIERRVARTSGALRHWGCGALSLVVATLALAAPPPPMKPLVEPASDEHHVGQFVYVELVTPDLAGAKTFYGKLLGWTFHDVKVGARWSTEASLDDHLVAGLVERPMRANESRQPIWLSFVAVTDVDAVRKAAEAKGGRSLSDPRDVPGLGRFAVLADPQGAVIGILASSSGDPPEVLPSVGDWIWASLFTTDPDRSAAFYQTLFDYEVFDDLDPEDDQHLVLAAGGYSRAAVNPLPAEGARPHWLNYVRVDDTVATTQRAVALGGKVLLAPRDDRHGGKLAILADPQGAPFGLLEWREDASVKALP